MTGFFYARQIRIFDYPNWAAPLCGAIPNNMERLAAGNGAEIEFVRGNKSFREEQRMKEVLGQPGEPNTRRLTDADHFPIMKQTSVASPRG